jgi:hypothetical protein
MTHLMIREFWTLLMKHQVGSSAWYGSGCLWAPQHHPESSCCFVMPSQAIRASQALSGFTKPSISSMQGLGIVGKSCCKFQPGTWNSCHFLSTCQLRLREFPSGWDVLVKHRKAWALLLVIISTWAGRYKAPHRPPMCRMVKSCSNVSNVSFGVGTVSALYKQHWHCACAKAALICCDRRLLQKVSRHPLMIL